MITLKELGAAIRAAREMRGMSQIDLAFQVDREQPTISRLERGAVDSVEWSALARILRVLDLELTLSDRTGSGDVR